jgi:16S rRNA (adenine1518-N6/adenine1519-N6)-dimethyltransferase
MKLSDLAATLQEIHVTPVKTLGQNFLHDQNLARWIVERIAPEPDEFVVEIGPGTGALTDWAVRSGARVLAIEKDGRLANFLRERFAQARVEIVHQDALAFDVRTLFAHRRVKLLGNLPYYVSSQLLLRFLSWPSPISLALCMLQKEMARRLSAQAGEKDYGALTLVVQESWTVEYLRTVPATVFLPKPDVDSALILLRPRGFAELPDHDRETFVELVRRGFSQRRKQLQNLLRGIVPNWSDAAARLGFETKARAEELGLEQWIGLANFVKPIPISEEKSTAAERFPVVNEFDEVIGEAPRREVHANNLRHRAVHILVFNSAGELFLQKRSRWKDRHPGAWDSSAAGHVDAGEEYDSTAVRELNEELGIAAKLERIAKLPASENTGQEFIWLYQARHDGPFRLARGEIEGGAFFQSEIVSAWIASRSEAFAPGFVECWKAYRARAVT